jgi:hypothetical protein
MGSVKNGTLSTVSTNIAFVMFRVNILVGFLETLYNKAVCGVCDVTNLIHGAEDYSTL